MPQTQNRAVMTWLFTFAFIVAFLIVFGGFVRLTRSGLSITEWKILGLLKKHCKRRTRHLNPLLPNLEARERFLGSIPVEVGGATVFILPVEQMVRID